MPINIKNFINSLNLKSKNSDFQDLEHLDGVSISTICANLYSKSRDDLVMFYFRDGANYASVYTQSKIVSENIKWNLNIKSKKISSLIVNTRNDNAFTGQERYKGLKEIAEKILRHSEALGGISRFTVQMDNAELSHKQLLKSIELIGEKIKPIVG